MPETKSYKTDSGVYDIPEDHVADFLKDNPKATEVNSFVAGKDTFDIPIEKVADFTKENPNAKPLNQKKSPDQSTSASSQPPTQDSQPLQVNGQDPRDIENAEQPPTATAEHDIQEMHDKPLREKAAIDAQLKIVNDPKVKKAEEDALTTTAQKQDAIKIAQAHPQIQQIQKLYDQSAKASNPQQKKAIDAQIEQVKSQGYVPPISQWSQLGFDPTDTQSTAGSVGNAWDKYQQDIKEHDNALGTYKNIVGTRDALVKENQKLSGFTTDENGVHTIQGVSGIPEAISKGISDGVDNLRLGLLRVAAHLPSPVNPTMGENPVIGEYIREQQQKDEIKRSVLYPTEMKDSKVLGLNIPITKGAEMAGGILPLAAGTAVAPEGTIPAILSSAGIFGVSGLGAGYKQGFAEATANGADSYAAHDFANKRSNVEGITQAGLGAVMPLNKYILQPFTKNVLTGALAKIGVDASEFAATKMASNKLNDEPLMKDVDEAALSGGIMAGIGLAIEHGVKFPPYVKTTLATHLSKFIPDMDAAIAEGIKKGADPLKNPEFKSVYDQAKVMADVRASNDPKLTDPELMIAAPYDEEIAKLTAAKKNAVDKPQTQLSLQNQIDQLDTDKMTAIGQHRGEVEGQRILKGTSLIKDDELLSAYVKSEPELQKELADIGAMNADPLREQRIEKFKEDATERMPDSFKKDFEEKQAAKEEQAAEPTTLKNGVVENTEKIVTPVTEQSSATKKPVATDAEVDNTIVKPVPESKETPADEAKEPVQEKEGKRKGTDVGEEMRGHKFPTLQETHDILKSEEGSHGGVWHDPESEDSKFDSPEQGMRYAEEVHNVLGGVADEEHIPVYRAVEADDVDLDPYGIGEAWSFDLRQAKQFAKNNLSGKNIKIIRGYVPRENVNWEQAIKNYHNFSDLSDGDSEFELPIDAGSKIRNVDVVNYKEAKDLPPFNEPIPEEIKANEEYAHSLPENEVDQILDKYDKETEGTVGQDSSTPQSETDKGAQGTQGASGENESDSPPLTHGEDTANTETAQQSDGQDKGTQSDSEQEVKEPNTIGISHERQEKRATETGIEMPERGKGLTAEEAIKIGQDLLTNGTDPHTIAEDFKKDGLVSTDRLSIVRAHDAALVKESNAAISDHGMESPQAKEALAKEAAWRRDVVKPMQTEWHKIGMVQQGETDIDTGSWVGLQRSYETRTGKQFTPEQKVEAQKQSDRIKTLEQENAELYKKINEAHEQNIAKEPEQTKIERIYSRKQRAKKEFATALDNIASHIGAKHSLVGEERASLVAEIGKAGKALIDLGEASLDDVVEKLRPHIESLFKGKEKYDDYTTEIKDAVEAEVKSHDIHSKFVDKEGLTFEPTEAKEVWDYAKKQYLDKGRSFPEAVINTGADLGLTDDQVAAAISSPKGKKIADEAYYLNRKRLNAIRQAKDWVENLTDSKVQKVYNAIKKIPGALFWDKTFGHGTVAPITHAGMQAFRVSQAKQYWHFVGETFKGAYGKTFYEKAMARLQVDPMFIPALRSGLEIDPESDKSDYGDFKNPILDKIAKFGSETGKRGFNMLKPYRLEKFKLYYDGLSDASKSDPEVLKTIAQLVNHETGATQVPIPKWVSTLAFAPKLEVSRWQKGVVDPLKAIKTLTTWDNSSTADKIKAKIVIRKNAEIMAVMASTLVANAAMQAWINPKNPVNLTDPSKPDFLKYKAGNFTGDISGGQLSTMSFIYRLMHLTVESKEQRHGEGVADKAGSLALQYARGKLGPLPQIGADFFMHRDMSGNEMPNSNDAPKKGKHKMTWGEYAAKTFAPIPIAEGIHTVEKAMDDKGISSPETQDILTGIFAGAASGITGAKISATSDAKLDEQANKKETQESHDAVIKSVKDYATENPNATKEDIKEHYNSLPDDQKEKAGMTDKKLNNLIDEVHLSDQEKHFKHMHVKDQAEAWDKLSDEDKEKYKDLLHKDNKHLANPSE